MTDPTAFLSEVAVALTAEFEAAWNAHDMTRLGHLLTDGVDWITVAGVHLSGKAQVEQVHAELHRAQLRSTVWANRSFTVSVVGEDLALLHLRWSVLSEGAAPREGLFTWVLQAIDGHWRIRAAQGTNIAAP